MKITCSAEKAGNVLFQGSSIANNASEKVVTGDAHIPCVSSHVYYLQKSSQMRLIVSLQQTSLTRSLFAKRRRNTNKANRIHSQRGEKSNMTLHFFRRTSAGRRQRGRCVLISRGDGQLSMNCKWFPGKHTLDGSDPAWA